MKSTNFFLCLVFLLISLTSIAQSIKNFEAQWKKVDEYVSKNLPKSALAEVKKIYELAKKEKQEAQIIKSLVYTIGLQQQTREESEIAGIQEIEKEILLNKEPAASILKSILAGEYWQYFQRNRWKLYNRTNTLNYTKTDIASWTSEDLHEKISELYLASLKNKTLLRQTQLQPYEAILVKGNVRYLRPTLFDLLAHRALQYFKNDEREIKKPAFAFEINQQEAFAPVADFVNAKFITKDSLSLQHKALLIYQDLIAFHLNDTRKDALIDVDIERLEFVKQTSVLANKNELYKKALENIIAKYPDNPVTAQAGFLLAAHYESLAATYDPLKDTAHRYTRLKSKEILEKIVNDSSANASVKRTEGWVSSYNLLKEINKQHLEFVLEKVNVPGQPFRSLVKYKNFNRLYLRIIKLDEKLKLLLKDNGEKYWPALFVAVPLKSWQQPLSFTNDLQQHAVEIKIDSLLIGEYVLLASSSAAFNDKNSATGARSFYVSNISYAAQNNNYFVLHRETGKPLPAAQVQVLENYYDYNSSKYINRKGSVYKTDDKGYFLLASGKEKNNRNTNISLDITYQKDRLNLDERLYNIYYDYDVVEDDAIKSSTYTYFFTDRSLYRPGQKLYFKGIVVGLGKQSNSSNIQPDFTTTVYLQDANGQLIDSIKLTTNQFGSLHGNFQLPQNILNGDFTILAKEQNGSAHIKVEEYKRPKFYVKYEKPKTTYKVNDKISVPAIAMAYAGNTIDGAKVSYRVVRQPRFLYPWLFWRGWYPQVQPMEIAHGETITDKDGKFNIVFTAIPDLSIDKKLEPVFDYKVNADVTDISGETRSNETIISTGYKALLLEVNIPQVLAIDNLKTISIRTQNMNGEFQPAAIKISIYELKPEQRLIRQRYWHQPDQFVMTKEEFIKNFPHDEYRNEGDMTTWERGQQVYTRTDTAKANSQFSILNSQLRAGYYAIEIDATGKDGETVKDVRYIELTDPKQKELISPKYLFVNSSNPAIEPGEKTSLQIGSSATDVFVIHQTDKATNEKRETRNDFITLNNEKKTFDFAATEADRGGYGVNFFFVKHNRLYQHGEVINVPWTNKDLQIEYASFRDKTLPGSKEQWKIKIKGYKNELVAAEMLASMYDASLDQFYAHDWTKPNLWRTYSNRLAWNGSQNFAAVQSEQKWNNDEEYKQFEKVYDEFVFNRFTRYGRLERALEGRASGIVTQDAAAPSMNKESRQEELADQTSATSDSATGIKQNKIDNNGIQIRKKFNETAFFLPDLRTDKDGNIEFSFTLPEALTRWKFQALTHSKDLALGMSQKEIITQKELMVQPNAPRFLRQGDRMEFSAKIVNLTDKEFTGQAQLELIDIATNQSVDGWFQNIFPNQYFTVAAGQSEAVKFPIEIPFQFTSALAWRVVARAGNISDGEEAAIPVLTNKLLVTETLPMPMRGTGTKTFKFEKLINSLTQGAETLQHHTLTFEYTANPAWYAVQALPYLIENKNESSEQTWNRYYANSLAAMIANSSPRIQQIFTKWKTIDTAALISNLQKNEELKSALLEETPWVLQAKTEAEQKKNIALLFDIVKMGIELKNSLEKLKAAQSSNGGFVWFEGGPDDRYMTQYIITGIGHLQKLKAVQKDQEKELQSILKSAIAYLDKKIKEDYDNLVKSKAKLSQQNISYIHVQYLYMRSFFPQYPVAASSQTAYNYYRKQSQQYWMKGNKFMQGMAALSLNRTGDKQTPKAILRSLKETSINNEELGMYWKENSFGRSWFWWYAPIETQALLIEAFYEITNDKKIVDDLKTWLIKNKQTNNWRTTKATADACYAMLLQGTELLTNEPIVTIKTGTTSISNITEKEIEAGTSYFKKTISGNFIKPEMGNISISVEQPKNSNSQQSNMPLWGAAYWQYFQDLDKITNASTPLQLNKKLFIEKNSDRGPVLTPVGEGTGLQVGNKLKVRIELRVDRDMEYVHMKDMRASALEPVNVISGYKWQGGLGYYETTKDASTSFFFSYLRKGTYVFEYPLFVTHAGNFSNGITTIQCLYAPEFSAHSEGVRLRVEAPSIPQGGN